MDDVQAVATSISTVHIENDKELSTKSQAESEKIKNSNQTMEEISAEKKCVIEEKMEFDITNDGEKSLRKSLLLEPQQDKLEIVPPETSEAANLLKNDEKQMDKQSGTNLDDFTTTVEEEVPNINMENIKTKEKPIQQSKCTQIPPEQWPQFPQFKKVKNIYKINEFFIQIEENLVLSAEAESKESKSLQCECNPSSKEKKRGKACGNECLNRLLMMECGEECRSGKYCTNRRFQMVK